MELIPNKRLINFLNDALKQKPELQELINKRKSKHIEISNEAKQKLQEAVALYLMSLVDVEKMTKERRITIKIDDIKWWENETNCRK